MKRAVPSLTKRRPEADSDRVKTPYPNLIRYKPSSNYFGRGWFNGKLIRPDQAVLLRSQGPDGLEADNSEPATVLANRDL